MTTMKTTLYTVLTAALLSTTVLSTAQGASASDSSVGPGVVTSRNLLSTTVLSTKQGEGSILSLLASLKEIHATTHAVVRSKILLTNDDFNRQIAGMPSKMTLLNLSDVTMTLAQRDLLFQKLGLLCFEQTSPASSDGIDVAEFSKSFNAITVSKLEKIIFGRVNHDDVLSILTAFNCMLSVKNIEFATPPVMNAASLKVISSFRPDLIFGFTYNGPLDPLLEILRVRSLPQLTTLSLANNSIGDAGAAALAEALRHMPELTNLNLWMNDIGAVGATALTDVLSHLPKLRVLVLSGNRIGAAGARALDAASRQRRFTLML